MKVEKIGNCSLYLGDCLEILPTLGNIDIVITDPPYGMRYVSNHRNKKYEPIENDHSAELALKVIDWARKNARSATYVFGRHQNIIDYPVSNSVITWIKNIHSAGDLKHSHGKKTELIFFYAGHSHSWNKKRPVDIVYADRSLNNYHPTQKPVSLINKIISYSKGNTIIDPCMGSGTTGVSCVNLNRQFIGIEINQKYFDISCKRIEEAVKQYEKAR